MFIRIATIALVTTFGTSALADQSDRYDDLRLHTALPDVQVKNTIGARLSFVQGSDASTPEQLRFAQRQDTPDNRQPTSGEGFPYGGFGPYNDSR